MKGQGQGPGAQGMHPYANTARTLPPALRRITHEAQEPLLLSALDQELALREGTWDSPAAQLSLLSHEGFQLRGVAYPMGCSGDDSTAICAGRCSCRAHQTSHVKRLVDCGRFLGLDERQSDKGGCESEQIIIKP